MAAVAAVAHAVLDVPWAAAFVLGAVLGPTDPVSAAAVLDRLGVTGRAKTILQGESLINDATGLTASGSRSPPRRDRGLGRPRSLEFVWVVAAGIAIGFAAGWVFAHLRRIVTDPSLDVALSLLTPFVAYVPAEKLHVSGVLATVVAGLYVGSRSLDIIEPGTRLRTLAFWDSTAFLLDGLLFVLIGLQVPSIVDRIEDADLLTLSAYALLIAAVVMGVRMLWMVVVPTSCTATTRARADRDRLERDARRRLAGRGAGDHHRGLPQARPRDLRRLRGDRADAGDPRPDAGAARAPGRAAGERGAPAPRRRGAPADHARRRSSGSTSLDDAPDHIAHRLRDRYGSRIERLEARVEGDEDEHGRPTSRSPGRRWRR